jgi:hypothetical protein
MADFLPFFDNKIYHCARSIFQKTRAWQADWSICRHHFQFASHRPTAIRLAKRRAVARALISLVFRGPKSRSFPYRSASQWMGCQVDDRVWWASFRIASLEPQKAQTLAQQTDRGSPELPASNAWSALQNGRRNGRSTNKCLGRNRGVESTSWAPSENGIKISNLRGRFGGPGGRIKIVDFIEFFVDQNQKSSRIVPYGSAANGRRLVRRFKSWTRNHRYRHSPIQQLRALQYPNQTGAYSFASNTW